MLPTKLHILNVAYGLLTSAMFVPFDMASQEKDPIRSDRPGQSFQPHVLAPHTWQVELGPFAERSLQADTQTIALAMPDFLLKRSLSPNLEGHLQLRPTYGLQTTALGRQQSLNLAPAELGFKTRLFHSANGQTLLSFLLHATLPFSASGSMRQAHLETAFRFILQWEVSDRLSLLCNLGLSTGSSRQNAGFLYTLSCQYNFCRRAGCYTEYYAFMAENQWQVQHRINAGLVFLMGNNVQWDLSAGCQLLRARNYGFISAGCTLRLPDRVWCQRKSPSN